MVNEHRNVVIRMKQSDYKTDFFNAKVIRTDGVDVGFEEGKLLKKLRD